MKTKNRENEKPKKNIIRRFLDKEYKISLVNLLSVTISLIAIGCIVGMASRTLGWIAICILIMLIAVKLEPYIQRVLRGLEGEEKE